MMTTPLILLSNDDGFEAKGLRALRGALGPLGRVITVAPATQQSAGSHALTLSRPLRHRRPDTDLHVIDGSPADTVYLALHREGFLPRRPDLVVSGINHGYNLGLDVYYSGTVAAAREAALRGIDSIAFSMAPRGDMALGAEWAARIVSRFFETPGERDGATLLNVNFPTGSSYNGLRATRLGGRIYEDAVEVRHDPRGREYYWLGGKGAVHESQPGTDTEAVDAGFVSVSPLALDPTDPNGLGIAAWVAGDSGPNKDEEAS